ncbi:MAG: membrane or secreted protein [Chitinophagaceae bacterium]|nr:MAG: membrane or secreted protein [Chitinophagaceae bacterium]
MKTLFSSLLFLLSLNGFTQTRSTNLVYVDGAGVLRYTRGGGEAAFFGTNYTVPFAYGYRSHRALGIDLEKAIDADVAHLARLGLDAFRVHVWDVEISDSAGNLLNNEHLRLFDYLLMRLKERNIKILVTPIAFWGNGYPERDEKTPGFATKYGKGQSVVKEEAIVAQERYLKQFFAHVNPYTKLSYVQDPDVIAMEINNEPHHSGPRERTTEYVNRLAAAVRSSGWTKPVFYNISESPSYAGAVVAANVDGHSFQWYPTGLVANHEQKGNFLPNVDEYRIPFFDSLPALRKRALMVYEFDAGDVLQSNMYPAMARAFRSAGFQWATQFAYDPMHTAHANTEYQTHFLNLAYTPGKAISMLIAGKAFRQLPRGKSWGRFPADTSFDVFRVSYTQDLSEMNSDTAFFYSNRTTTIPRNAATLRHVAGVGSSPVVQYEGSGAYFLDRLPNGNWRLELYPDALVVNDPFGKAAPSRDAVRIHYAANKMQLQLPGLSTGFKAVGLDSANRGVVAADANGLLLRPGVYELGAAPVAGVRVPFFAPKDYAGAPFCLDETVSEAFAGMPVQVRAQIAGLQEADKVSVELRHSLNKWKTVQMQRRAGNAYVAELPAEMQEAGLLEYRILVQQTGGAWHVFPGAAKGNPYAWDYVGEERYRLRILPANAAIILFAPERDRARMMTMVGDWRKDAIGYTYNDDAQALQLRATMNEPKEGAILAWQVLTGDVLKDRPLSELARIAVRGRSAEGRKVRIRLIDRHGRSVEADAALTPATATVEIPLTSFVRGGYLLLPRPYPGFQPLTFTSDASSPFDLAELDKIECSFGHDIDAAAAGKKQSIGIESIRLIN